jgi:hypothetical protein
MSRSVKIKIYKMVVKSAVVFGSETWAVAEMEMKRLGTGASSRERNVAKKN